MIIPETIIMPSLKRFSFTHHLTISISLVRQSECLKQFIEQLDPSILLNQISSSTTISLLRRYSLLLDHINQSFSSSSSSSSSSTTTTTTTDQQYSCVYHHIHQQIHFWLVSCNSARPNPRFQSQKHNQRCYDNATFLCPVEFSERRRY